MSDQTIWVHRTDVAQRYGVNPRTIVRWEKDQEMGFPKPREIRGRFYTSKQALDAYDAREEVRS